MVCTLLNTAAMIASWVSAVYLLDHGLFWFFLSVANGCLSIILLTVDKDPPPGS